MFFVAVFCFVFLFLYFSLGISLHLALMKIKFFGYNNPFTFFPCDVLLSFCTWLQIIVGDKVCVNEIFASTMIRQTSSSRKSVKMTLKATELLFDTSVPEQITSEKCTVPFYNICIVSAKMVTQSAPGEV